MVIQLFDINFQTHSTTFSMLRLFDKVERYTPKNGNFGRRFITNFMYKQQKDKFECSSHLWI